MLPNEPNSLQRRVQRLTASRLVSCLLSGTLNPLDRLVLRLTGGRNTATRTLAGIPVLSVETTGARTGRRHAVTLLAIPYATGYILVATAFGSRRDPAWYHNLLAHPTVRVTLRQVTRPFQARVTTGDERQACWEQALAVYPGYAAYLQRARRPIPVLLLTPID
jgi:deazaflavin-dependent oxidoreductase (nitroreductase family)